MLFVPYVRLSGRLLGNSCLLGLRHDFLVKVSECQFMFFILVFAVRKNGYKSAMIRKRRNQKEISTQKPKWEKTKLTIRYLYIL